jgi:hypothetical protein
MSTTVRAVVLSALLVLSVLAAPFAMATPVTDELDTNSDHYQGVKFQEDTLTLDNFDRGDHTDPTDTIEYDSDDADVTTLPATVNTSQDEPVGVNFSKIKADKYHTFPRVDGETDEDDDGVGEYSWTDHSNWSTATISVNDRTIAGNVPAVQVASNGSMTAGDTATATFSQNVSIDTDPGKRVLQLGYNVQSLGSSANVSIRLVDDDGDYYAGYIDTDGNLTDNAWNLTNQSGTGYVAQVRASDLDESGTVNEISKIEVVVQDDDATLDIFWLDAGSKSVVDLGETNDDSDGDGDDEAETIQEIDGQDESGVVKLTGYSTMGEWADNAELNDAEVYDVWYRAEDLTDSDDVSIETSDATSYGAYDKLVESQYRLTVPTPIDLSHGDIDLVAEQQLVGERYAVVKYAEDTEDTDLGNVSDGDYTSKVDSFTTQDETVTLDDSVTAGDNYIVTMELLYSQGEFDDLTDTSGGAAPAGGSGGGFWSFLSNPLTWIAGVGALVVQRVRGSFPFGG